MSRYVSGLRFFRAVHLAIARQPTGLDHDTRLRL